MRTNALLSALLLAFIISLPLSADDSWRDKTDGLRYTPRYFGANAFPLPILTAGKLSASWEAELRGEYHKMDGDKTKDLFARLYIPIASGKAGVSLCGVIREWYETSPEVRDERSAVEVKSPIPCYGDFIISCHYQVLASEKWADIVASASLKTASGGRLCDARYTDAASYWFDCNIGRTLWQENSLGASFRLHGMAGFYCWMTNSAVHRQNDALTYALGLKATLKCLTLDLDYTGIRGYRGDGDKPMVLRTKLNCEVKKNILSIGFKHGLRDYLYNSFSIAYIRRF